MVAALKSPPDAQVMAQLNPWFWAYANKIKLMSGAFQLNNHEYLVRPMSVDAPVRVCMKATQGGFTEVEVLRSTWGLTHNHYPLGVLYLFPTKDDVTDFSKTRFAPLIAANPESIGRYVKGTDSENLKRIGSGFIYFRSGNLAKDIQDTAGHTKSSARVKSLPADHAVLDELDEMTSGIIGFARGRMAHSTVRTISLLANPTIPEYGVAGEYEKTDQERWFTLCSHCGHYTCLDDDACFPNCFRRQKDGSVLRVCAKCERPIDPRVGTWIAAYPDREKDRVGFHIGHPSMPFQDPRELLDDWEDPKTNKAIFTRLRRGRPFFDPVLLGCYFHSEMAQAEGEGRIPLYLPDMPHIPVDTWWDLGIDDSTAIWFTRNVDDQIWVIHYYENMGLGVRHYANQLQKFSQKYGFVYRNHTGPHDIAVREWGTGMTRAETAFREHGIVFRAAPKPQRKEDSIDLARELIAQCVFAGERCEQGLKALRMYRREYDEKLRAFRNKPLHDWASHGADSWQTLALGTRLWCTDMSQTQSRLRKAFGG